MRFLFFLLFFYLSPFLHAQKLNDETGLLSTPYKTLEVFASNTEEDNYNPEQAAIIFNSSNLSLGEKIAYVKIFEQILEGAGIFIFFNDVPTSPDFFDSIANENRYAISKRYPELYLQKINGKWQFQPRVIASMDKIHGELYKFSTHLLLNDKLRNSALSTHLLGLKLWQWLGIAIVLFLSWLIRYLFALFFGRVLMNVLDKIGHFNVGRKFILPVTRPTGMLVVFLFIAVFYPTLQLPRLVGFYVVLILKGLIPLYGMIILYRLVNIFEIYLLKLVEKTSSTLDDQLIPLVQKVLKTMIVVIGGLIILDNLNVPIFPLITGLSIGGLAFALAAQDTIKNFFGSLMIFVDKPFQVGDWITSGDIDGTIEEVGFRSTRIRTFRNSLISVPNGKLADSMVDNNGLRQFRRYRTIIKITYGTPPDLVETYVEGLKKILHSHPQTNKEKYEIHFTDLGDSSLDILFYIFFEAATWTDELNFRQEVLLDIMKLAKHLGIQFAFPTQTLQVENLPGQPSHSPKMITDKGEMSKKLDAFFKA